MVTDLDESTALSEDEILAFLSKRKGLLDGVCITGGEPLINKDIADFIAKIKAMGYSVKLDTNGTFPDALRKLLSGGLVDYVAMDIKNSPEKYAETVGLESINLGFIEESIEIIAKSGIGHEFRTTVVKEFHETADIVGIARMIPQNSCYFLQNFEDSGDLIGNNLSSVGAEALTEMRNAASAYVKNIQIRGI